MSRYGGPKLPKFLLNKVEGGRVSKRQRKEPSRKEQRKHERVNKKRIPIAKSVSHPRVDPRDSIVDDEEEDADGPVKAQRALKGAAEPRSDNDDEDEDEDEEVDELAERPLSGYSKRRLQDDDDEIAALEKKLGLKGKKSQKIGDDELDWLVYGSGSENDEHPGKRKRPDDDAWLRNKRSKATKRDDGPDSDLDNPFSEDEYSEEDLVHGLDDSFSKDDELSAEEQDDFQGFGDDAADDVSPKKLRENPYIAPVAQRAPSAKYIPPSMRQAPSSDEETLKQLRRQIQGQLNRLSEANMPSILQAVQDFYARNARQHVTSTIVDLLRGLICDPAVLNDTFLILHAGFAAALYRSTGTDFGAQLLESFVRAFDDSLNSQIPGEEQKISSGKQGLNLLAFLSYLYVLNAIASDIIFDYIKILLNEDNFSEANTELLLRVIRVAGTQLRQDDPTSLKDIILLLQRTIAAIGNDKISVRTKFMIETMQDLKNNRMKTGIAASALSAEHLARMKKTLGSIKSGKSVEPLRITLADIRDSDKKGKWWLVGASYRDPAKMASAHSGPTAAKDDEEQDEGSESDGSVNLDKLARAQGMNTDVRRAIFVCIAGAVDAQHAYMRIMKLNLKNKQQLEIPRVLLHCVAAEPVYNHYYTLVATQFCGDHKLRKAYQFALLDVFRRLGENDDDADGDEEGNNDELTVPKIYNTAKLYATLIAESLLRVTILKPLDFANVQPKTGVFLNVLFNTMFVLLRKKAHKGGFEQAVKDTFSLAHAAPQMVSALKYYLTAVVPAADIAANKKEAKVVKRGCDYAVEAMANTKARVPIEDDYLSEDE